jgi:hypothetical protein
LPEARGVVLGMEIDTVSPDILVGEVQDCPARYLKEIRHMKSLVWVAVLCLTLAGCDFGPPYRWSRDNATMVPLSGLGDRLPKAGTIPPQGQGPIYYDSLYWQAYTAEGQMYVAYTRFWPSGRLLTRHKVVPAELIDRPGAVLTADDGNVIDDWLAGPANRRSSRATVGRFCVVGTCIELEWFSKSYDGCFQNARGVVSETGFTITAARGTTMLLRPKPWQMSDQGRFTRCHVGSMLGEPTW